MDNPIPQIIHDHDLLIRIDEQIRGLKTDMNDLKSGFAERVAVIESVKADKSEMISLQVESDKVHDDHEKRLRVVETVTSVTATQIKTWGSIAVFFLALLQIALKFLIK